MNSFLWMSRKFAGVGTTARDPVLGKIDFRAQPTSAAEDGEKEKI